MTEFLMKVNVNQMKMTKKEKVQPALAPVAAPQQPAQPLVSFDSWWITASKSIPRQHAKEIIWADMQARGVKEEEPLAVYEAALRKYGL